MSRFPPADEERRNRDTMIDALLRIANWKFVWPESGDYCKLIDPSKPAGPLLNSHPTRLQCDLASIQKAEPDGSAWVVYPPDMVTPMKPSWVAAWSGVWRTGGTLGGSLLRWNERSIAQAGALAAATFVELVVCGAIRAVSTHGGENALKVWLHKVAGTPDHCIKWLGEDLRWSVQQGGGALPPVEIAAYIKRSDAMLDLAQRYAYLLPTSAKPADEGVEVDRGLLDRARAALERLP